MARQRQAELPLSLAASAETSPTAKKPAEKPRQRKRTKKLTGPKASPDHPGNGARDPTHLRTLHKTTAVIDATSAEETLEYATMKMTDSFAADDGLMAGLAARQDASSPRGDAIGEPNFASAEDPSQMGRLMSESSNLPEPPMPPMSLPVASEGGESRTSAMLRGYESPTRTPTSALQKDTDAGEEPDTAASTVPADGSGDEADGSGGLLEEDADLAEDLSFDTGDTLVAPQATDEVGAVGTTAVDARLSVKEQLRAKKPKRKSQGFACCVAK
jgi:hypothetical protein